MQCTRYGCLVLMTMVWASAQIADSHRPEQLYPSDQKLAAAAKSGYAGRKNIELFPITVHTHRGRASDCLPLTQTIGVAGPLALAAMQGRTAYLKSLPLPESGDLLHVKGTVLLRLVSYAVKKDDSAEAWMVQGAQQIHPISEKLEAVGTESCRVAEGGQNNEAFTAQVIWRVSALYVFRFQADAPQPDWNSPITVFVRKNGNEEKYDINIGKILDHETESLR